MKDFHQLARQIEVLEMANPNRTVAAARERAARAARAASERTRTVDERIAAGKAVRGRIDLTKDYGVGSWSAESLTQPHGDETWNQALVAAGTSLDDWMGRVNRYYRGFGKDEEKERKAFGRNMDAYMKATRTKVLAPHARKIADAYMQSCIKRGIEWRLVADPYYDLKDIYVMYQGTPNERKEQNDSYELIRILEGYLRQNTRFGTGKKTFSRSTLHNLAVNIVRWVIENPT